MRQFTALPADERRPPCNATDEDESLQMLFHLFVNAVQAQPRKQAAFLTPKTQVAPDLQNRRGAPWHNSEEPRVAIGPYWPVMIRGSADLSHPLEPTTTVVHFDSTPCRST
jgi:hypothetical protein